MQEHIEIELSELEEAYQRAFAYYVLETQKILALLETGDLEAVHRQRAAERLALERFRQARNRYVRLRFALIQRKAS